MKTLTIREVKNGYVVTLCGEDYKDHEEFVLKDLPSEVKKLFAGEIKGSKLKSNDEYRDESFDKAEEEAMESEEEDDETEE